MDLFWIIYLIDITGSIKTALVILAMVSGITGLFIGLMGYLNSEWDNVKVAFFLVAKVFFFALTVGLFIPKTDTAYKMLAAYGVTEAYAAAQSSDKVNAIAGKSLEVLEKAMDDYLTKEEK